MKYVCAWETRQNFSEELQARILQVFSNWSPHDKLDYLQFLGRIDGRGGFAVVETDDSSAIASDLALFAPFIEFSVHPVLEIAEIAQIGGEAVSRRQSMS